MCDKMWTSTLLAFCLCASLAGPVFGQNGATNPTLAELAATQKKMEKTIDLLTAQLMQQELFVEERVRSDGMSGVKKLRLYHQGTSSYFDDSYVSVAALSAHDHANYDRTVGLGEFIAVMNGVEFRTRHNDYKLRMPASNKNYHASIDIPFPNVPPQVLGKHTVQEQIKEMQEFFRAFRDQNVTHRDYRPYFKPVLCVLEGAWTLNTGSLQEPFQSDRHFIDANSWAELQEKVRFTSYTGAKSNKENFSWLPTKFFGSENGTPKLAQWNYRIICHPLSFDVSTDYFQQQDDLTHRLSEAKSMEEVLSTRAARFKINEFSLERETIYTLLDRMMAEVPGKDNYGANHTDKFPGAGTSALDVSKLPDQVDLNTGFYHRWYKTLTDGAMGRSTNHRGFNDENLWVAFTSQHNIMPLSATNCLDKWHCDRYTQRVSYALPLEIIYMTPLFKWNPHQVAFYPGNPSTDPQARQVYANGRNGGLDLNKAYNGTNKRFYYRTPRDFFDGGKPGNDRADTAKGTSGVLGRDGKLLQMAASGVRVLTQQIGGGVGKVRLRYPIFPVHEEGSTVGSELQALKAMVMNMRHYSDLYETQPLLNMPNATNGNIRLTMSPTNRNPPGRHYHVLELTPEEQRLLISGTDFNATTSFAVGHSHELWLHFDAANGKYTFKRCDGLWNCADGHKHGVLDVY